MVSVHCGLHVDYVWLLIMNVTKTPYVKFRILGHREPKVKIYSLLNLGCQVPGSAWELYQGQGSRYVALKSARCFSEVPLCLTRQVKASDWLITYARVLGPGKIATCGEDSLGSSQLVFDGLQERRDFIRRELTL